MNEWKESEALKHREEVVVFLSWKAFGNRLDKHLSKMTVIFLEKERWREGFVVSLLCSIYVRLFSHLNI